MDLDLDKKRRFLFALEKIARETGQKVLCCKKMEISDTHEYKGHESSTVDAYAREKMQSAIDTYLPDFEGIIRFELRPFSRSFLEKKDQKQPMVLIIDEIDGTTNTKRCLAANLDYRPVAGVSIALSLSELLKDLVVGVFYTLDSGETFSSFRMEKEFLSFRNNVLMDPSEIAQRRGDSKKRILVVGYSNSHRKKKGEVEQALFDDKFTVYDGCRASSMDIINIIRNAYDAYIDLRTYWSTRNEKGEEKEAMLQVYDVAGVIPVVEGCGLVATDALGEPWERYGLDDSIPLVIARPDIHSDILRVIKPFVRQWKNDL